MIGTTTVWEMMRLATRINKSAGGLAYEIAV
jgi:hypothetical protein